MTRLKITFNCGCGYIEKLEADLTPGEKEFTSFKELVRTFKLASGHSNQQTHNLEFRGEIRGRPG